MAVQKATAEGLAKIKEVQLDDGVIRLRSLEAFEKVANGTATKIIIPSEIQSMAGVVASAAELLKN